MNLPAPEDIHECDLLLRRAIQHRNRNNHDPYVKAAVPIIIDGLLDHRNKLGNRRAR